MNKKFVVAVVVMASMVAFTAFTKADQVTSAAHKSRHAQIEEATK